MSVVGTTPMDLQAEKSFPVDIVLGLAGEIMFIDFRRWFMPDRI